MSSLFLGVGRGAASHHRLVIGACGSLPGFGISFGFRLPQLREREFVTRIAGEAQQAARLRFLSAAAPSDALTATMDFLHRAATLRGSGAPVTTAALQYPARRPRPAAQSGAGARGARGQVRTALGQDSIERARGEERMLASDATGSTSAPQLSVKRLFSLQWQITAAVALGLIALFGTFGAIAYTTIKQSTDTALHEREAIARLSADTIESLTRHVVDQMEAVADLPAIREGNAKGVEVLLGELRSSLDTVESLSLADFSTGRVWTAPETSPARSVDWLSVSQVVAAMKTGQTQISNSPPAHAEEEHPAFVVIAVPVNPANPGDTAVSRVLAAELHLRGEPRGLAPLPRFGRTSGVTIIDEYGRVLASSAGAVMGKGEEHFRLLADFLEKGKGGVAIHRPPTGSSHVVAFAPFALIPGGVIVEEREDAVLAVPQRLRRNLLLFGLLGLALSSLLAWLHAWHTMRPVKRLTAASQLIAAGVLDRPVRIDRHDEIGLLARSFDVMRQKLQAAEQRRAQWEEEMESRVKDRTARVQTLLRRVISAQEEERKRIARELHDEVAQNLATLLITLQRLSDSSSGLGDEDRATVLQAQEHLAYNLREMRRTISDLRPSALDDLGLVAAIRGYAESRAGVAGLRVQFESSGVVPDVDGPTQTTFFRIVQEAISNVVRHADAEHMSIGLSFSARGLEATIEDDGRGFDVAEVAAAGGAGSRLGILGMNERAALVNGRVKVESPPGRGTRVSVWLPVSEERDSR